MLLLLNEVDPYGLEPGLPEGAPEDEYEYEAAPIAVRLFKDGTITAAQVDAIWLRWFGETLTEALGPARVDQLVARLDRIVEPTTAPPARHDAPRGRERRRRAARRPLTRS
ncbi:hypothetical protein H9623_08760 [Oerskovia sp. Sa1BUA8]|uniref:Uncharacterized protein n=1 Tax=Oerskovia douganii TaxID=2762210 RepID=A0A9D5U9Q5_9CELL|nr:hypothetical protein [Oerskovia douganii]MBE7700394.1 hypothetical protein [Oerskovia douganii]